MDRPVRRRRGVRLGSVLLAAIAIPLMLLTLFSLERFALLPDDLNAGISATGQILIQLVTIVGAIAVVIGIFNLCGVHLRNLRKFPNGLYSLLTLLSLALVIVLRILERLGILRVEGSDAPLVTMTIMDAVQVVVESALAGLLFFFLVYAAYRMLRRGVTFWNVLFLAALVIVLVGYSPLTGMEFLSTIRSWVLNVPVSAGTRGLLIGIAIGTVTVGVRLLIGQDRTFRE
jgi:hypothetical protein